MLIGVSRGVFSNEAGVGTEVMAHGAAKTREPIPTFDALTQLRDAGTVAKQRGVSLDKVFKG